MQARESDRLTRDPVSLFQLRMMQTQGAEPLDILMVNWNGKFFLRHFLPLLLELTDPAHRVLIWDNASVDGSRALLRRHSREWPGRVQVRYARTNLGHARGLMRLLEASDRNGIVFLDCDAVPLRRGWVDELVEPLRSGATASGIWFANYLHPSCLCTTQSALRDLGVRLEPVYSESGRRWKVVRDVLQDLTLQGERQGCQLTKLWADGDYLFDGFGQTYGGGLLYHHWFGTRLNPAQGVEETQEGRTREGLQASLVAVEHWLREKSLWREMPSSLFITSWVDGLAARLSAE